MSGHLESQNGQEAAIREESSSAKRCPTFKSGGLLLFLGAKHITRIVNGYSITHPPLVSPLVRGIINLRGRIFPVADIRVCMDESEAEYTNKTCIVVLSVDNIPPGVVVSSVCQIMDINLDCVCPAPLKRQQELLDGMTAAEDDSVLMSFDCTSLASCRY